MSAPAPPLVPLSAAQTCQARGWRVGDVLQGRSGREGPTLILLTAIEGSTVSARRYRRLSETWGEENRWRLDLRAWEKVDA